MKFRINPGFTASLLIFMMNISISRTLSCHRTEYVFGTECCPMCPVGHRVKTDCEVDKSTSCQPCSKGTFSDRLNGLKHCLSCTECSEASGLKIKTSCTKSSDSVCEPLEGFYCSVPAEGGCGQAKRHRRCDPGEYIRHAGTSSTDTECSTCSDGTFSDGTFPSCQSHTQCLSEGLQLLRAGTKTEDAQCGQTSSVSTGLIVGIVVVVVLVIFLVLGLVAAWLHIKKIKRLKRKRSSSSQTHHMEHLNPNGDMSGPTGDQSSSDCP